MGGYPPPPRAGPRKRAIDFETPRSYSYLARARQWPIGRLSGCWITVGNTLVRAVSAVLRRHRPRVGQGGGRSIAFSKAGRRNVSRGSVSSSWTWTNGTIWGSCTIPAKSDIDRSVGLQLAESKGELLDRDFVAKHNTSNANPFKIKRPTRQCPFSLELCSYPSVNVTVMVQCPPGGARRSHRDARRAGWFFAILNSSSMIF
jgi:hypothetical protein